MGCSYISDSITDITITEDEEVYMQFITPTWVDNCYSLEEQKLGLSEKGVRVSNNYSLAEFVPFGFPILGDSTDYGMLDNIVYNKNTELLEEFFNISIDDIFEYATQFRWGGEPIPKEIKNVEILKQLTVTFFKKDHYDYLSTTNIGTNGNHIDRTNEVINSIPTTIKNLSNIRGVDESSEDFIEFKERYSKFSIDEAKEYYFEKRWSRMFYNIKHELYIPSIVNYNMFEYLSIDVSFIAECQGQYRFIRNLKELNKVLRPSYSSGQDNNINAVIQFNDFIKEKL